MKVSELIELLSKENPDRIVVMAKDAEGNGYSPLSGCWAGAYRAETTWYGEAGFEAGCKLPDGYTEEDICDGEPAMILTPVN